VYLCSPHHPFHGIPVLTASSTTELTGAHRNIQFTVDRYTHLIIHHDRVPVSTHVIHHTPHRRLPRHPPHVHSALRTGLSRRAQGRREYTDHRYQRRRDARVDGR
jgi:hypothetical protein